MKTTLFFVAMALVFSNPSRSDEFSLAPRGVCEAAFSNDALLSLVCKKALANKSTFVITDLKTLTKSGAGDFAGHTLWDDAFVAAMKILQVLPAAADGRRHLQVPKGVYEVTSPSIVPSNVEILGTGTNTTDQIIRNLQGSEVKPSSSSVFVLGDYDGKAFIKHRFFLTAFSAGNGSINKFIISPATRVALGIKLGSLVFLRSEIGFIQYIAPVNPGDRPVQHNFRPELGTIDRVVGIRHASGGNVEIQVKYGIGDYDPTRRIVISAPGVMIPVPTGSTTNPDTPYTLPDFVDLQIDPRNAAFNYSDLGLDSVPYHVLENTKLSHVRLEANAHAFAWGGLFECELSDLSIRGVTALSSNGFSHSIADNVSGEYGYRAIELAYFTFGSHVRNSNMRYDSSIHYDKADNTPSPDVVISEGSRYNEIRDSVFQGEPSSARQTVDVAGVSTGGNNRFINNQFKNYLVTNRTFAITPPMDAKPDYDGEITPKDTPATSLKNCVMFNDFNPITVPTDTEMDHGASFRVQTFDAKAQVSGNVVLYNNFNDEFHKLYNPKDAQQQLVPTVMTLQTDKATNLNSFTPQQRQQKEQSFCGPSLF